ncbi:alpha-crystallin B chain-like isoform X1 [Rhynchophorus ferrugineus]|uniref:alpha-crystallin B chain-like isoform X1 n=1 Tax=Rhynchophorus ferrugineus TaxID=354439 RepID=UPI003FCE92B8
MALLPFFHNNDLFANHSAGSLLGWSEPDLNHWPLMLPSRSTEHLRDLRSQLAHLDRDTSVILDKNHFQADIDVQQFKPEEITVKLSGEHTITVEGRHEDQQDDHGFISRHFVRRYLLPQDCDVSKVQSKLSSDGVLTISAPKKQQGIELDGEEIPIIHTGRPIIRRMHLWPSRRSDRKRRLSASK